MESVLWRKNEGKNLTEKQPNADVTRVAALLDFYSNRAVAHASFFIASIFGLLTFLAIVSGFKEIRDYPYVLSIFLFSVFTYMGYFTLIRFNYYASLADYLTHFGLKRCEVLNECGYSEEAFNRGRENQEWILLPKKLLMLLGRKAGLIAYPAYWIVVLLCGTVAYSRFWNSDWCSLYNWFYWWLISLVPILFLTLPGVLYLLYSNRKERKIVAKT